MLKEDLNNQMIDYVANVAVMWNKINVIKELGIGDSSGCAYPRDNKITIFSMSEEETRDIVKLLLPNIEKLDKKFNSDNGQLSLEGIYKGFRIQIHYDKPSTCEIKQVKTMKHIEAVPEHDIEVITYEAVGDCAPILGGENE